LDPFPFPPSSEFCLRRPKFLCSLNEQRQSQPPPSGPTSLLSDACYLLPMPHLPCYSRCPFFSTSSDRNFGSGQHCPPRRALSSSSRHPSPPQLCPSVSPCPLHMMASFIRLCTSCPVPPERLFFFCLSFRNSSHGSSLLGLVLLCIFLTLPRFLTFRQSDFFVGRSLSALAFTPLLFWGWFVFWYRHSLRRDISHQVFFPAFFPFFSSPFDILCLSTLSGRMVWIPRAVEHFFPQGRCAPPPQSATFILIILPTRCSFSCFRLSPGESSSFFLNLPFLGNPPFPRSRACSKVF